MFQHGFGYRKREGRAGCLSHPPTNRLIASGLLVLMLMAVLLPASPAQAVSRNDACTQAYAGCFSQCGDGLGHGIMGAIYFAACAYNCELSYIECIFRGFQEG